ncbi:D-alanine--D-alanine ligase family protein [Aurantiacibacter arachoides]|uniref:D-alanine--D-alanine ligase family protein n=1 Tax=Aurantiacibacter arachoides TaxID=1850444 RepID=UPI0019CD3BF9|nr:phosphoribosylglycinamide synthetase [Aurantiacibacter arachoides]GGD52434.1 D-alanine--D-alanine ligase [Aurantiacibacter arachoides]
MPATVPPLVIPAEAKEALRILFLAKNALWDGQGSAEDGNHARYHVEMRETLTALGLNLTINDNFDMLFDKPDVDFVFPLLNRAGFFNSEMLCPLLCERANIAYLGASPIVRGLGDDKHLAKRSCVAAGVPTAPWAIFRRGVPVDLSALPPAERWVIKPNNSSASWGVRDASDAKGVAEAVDEVFGLDHDAIVEPFLDGSDIEVPVITMGDPVVLPMMIFRQSDPAHLRTYQEKRDLVDRTQKYSLDPFEDAGIAATLAEYTRRLWADYRPFDYGRFEFRVNEDTGEIHFLEVNLNCNLWSQKVFGRAAVLFGWSHEQLIETILADSLRRNGLIA